LAAITKNLASILKASYPTGHYISGMDFFERYLGFSGGHGDALEALLVLVLVITITGIALMALRGAAYDNKKSPPS